MPLTNFATNSLFTFYVNTPPIANNDGPVRIITGGASVTLNVVTGSDSASRATVADSDADSGDTISITSVTQGSSGAIVTYTSLTVTYTASSSTFTGVETFSYTHRELLILVLTKSL